MRKRSTHWFLGSVIVLMLSYACKAQAQASLAAENIIDDVPLEVEGPAGKQKLKFTIIRDATNEDQWYYLPSQPTLTIIQTPDGAKPEFTLLRYAERDSVNSLKFNGGGLINFAVTLAAPDQAIPLLKQAISKYLTSKGRSVGEIRISALPFKSSSASIYSPKGNQLGDDPLGVGPSALFATQKMVFSLPVTKLGSDVYQSLIEGTTGIPLAIRFKFTGLTPPAGFVVEVNWQNAFKHYSENQEFRAQASYYGLFGASAAYSSTTIREQLEKAKAIKIEIKEGEGLTLSDIDSKFLQPILKRINDELIQEFQPPPQINPAVAPQASSGGYFASGSASVAVKNVSLIKTGSERIDFKYSKHVERETVASGFIGLGQFDKEVQKQLVTTVDNTLWQTSFLPLPVIPSAVDSVNMNVRLVCDGKTYDAQNLTFSRKSGWTNEVGQSSDRVSFSLLALKSDRGDAGVKKAVYDVDYSLQANDDTIIAKVQVPVIENGSASVAPKRFVDTVTIDPGGLPWKALGRGELVRVSIALKSGDQDFKHTFRPAMNGVQYVEPPALTWVVKRMLTSETKVSGLIEYRIGSSNRVLAFDNLNNISASMDIFLDERMEAAK